MEITMKKVAKNHGNRYPQNPKNHGFALEGLHFSRFAASWKSHANASKYHLVFATSPMRAIFHALHPLPHPPCNTHLRDVVLTGGASSLPSTLRLPPLHVHPNRRHLAPALATRKVDDKHKKMTLTDSREKAMCCMLHAARCIRARLT